jgi:hypothetical protein
LENLIHNIFSNLSNLILVVNLILFLKRFRSNSKSFKVFTCYLAVITLLQVISKILFYLKINNLGFSHVYFLSQFLLLSYFFIIILENIIIKRIIKLMTIIVMLILTVNYYLDPNFFTAFNLFEIVLCSIPLIFYSFIFFIQNLEQNFKKYLYLNSGIFIYLMCSTLLFVTGNYISPIETYWYRFIWVINAFLYLIYQLFIFTEWYKSFRKSEVRS